MKVYTLTATLTSRGIKYAEKEESASIKGKSTYVTEHGTFIDGKTLMVLKETLNNAVPTYVPPMMGLKIVCLEGDQEKAKILIFDRFNEIIKKAFVSLNELQKGIDVEAAQIYGKSTFELRRKRRVQTGEEGNQ